MYESTWKDPRTSLKQEPRNIAGAIGLGAAVDYLNHIGMRKIRLHEQELTRYAIDHLSRIKGISIYGPKDPSQREGVVSFNVGDIHAHDMATLLDEDAICVRSGHHCAQPLMERLGVSATTRASFYLYNTEQEVNRLVESLEKAKKVFSYELDIFRYYPRLLQVPRNKGQITSHGLRRRTPIHYVATLLRYKCSLMETIKSARSSLTVTAARLARHRHQC